MKSGTANLDKMATSISVVDCLDLSWIKHSLAVLGAAHREEMFSQLNTGTGIWFQRRGFFSSSTGGCVYAFIC